jgi:hypothetical protein
MWRRIRYLLVLTALCAIATCPSAHRACRAKVRAREAPALLDDLQAALTRLVAAGAPLPAVTSGPTPPLGRCCEQGGRCEVDPALWQAEPWKTLRFSLDLPHRFSVEYAPLSNGARLRVSGDVDCDGVQSSYELRATVDGKTVRFERRNERPHE